MFLNFNAFNMNIAIAQLNYHIGNFEYNTKKIHDAISTAIAQHANLIVFSELSVCGYPPRDFLEFSDFLEQCNQIILSLLPLSNQIAILIGAPSKNQRIEGKDLYNSAFLLHQAKILSTHHKALLPTYDVFDEYRYFEPATQFKTVQLFDKKIAIVLCEDMWNVGNENPLYTVCPLDEVMHEKPDFIINLSASPFDYNHAADRIKVLQANVERYKIPVIYCNQVGANTELVFDGGSLVLNAAGSVVMELPYFEECVRTVQIELISTLKPQLNSKNKPELIYKALVCGVKDYFEKSNFKKATLGLSGGIDSCLTLVIAVEALGKDNVLPVLMPSEYSSEHSVSDSVLICEKLGVKYEILSIERIYATFLSTLNELFAGSSFGVAEENLQSRSRAVLLMALCNKLGYILLNTSNKSELAVGYGTLYGDMCGGVGVLGDVYKTEVYDLARFVNKSVEIIPSHCIEKPPSAELRPNQKDSDSLPPYAVLDALLYQYIEQSKGPKELLALGFDGELVQRVLRMVNQAEHKRHQAPPIIRVSSKAFGSGRKLPIVANYLV